jgi:hypothetical protein
MSMITGRRKNQVVWPDFLMGATMVSYYDYLIYFGGQPLNRSSSVNDDITGRKKTEDKMAQLKRQMYEEAGVWIFDTKSDEWYVVRPEESFLANNSTLNSWPTNFNSREFMTANAVIDKGIVVYIGGQYSPQE